MLDVEFAQLSDFGKSRDHNEDYLGYAAPETAEQARTHGWLFALADGVGGHDDGEVASRAAVEHLTSGFRKAPKNEALGALLTRLVQEANLCVYETGKRASVGGSNMATTIVACALRYDRAAVAHAGDSRCYLIREGCATLLTRDHTVANEQLKLGILSAKEFATFAQSPCAGAVAGQRSVCERGFGRAAGAAGRRAGDVLRRAAQLGGRVGNGGCHRVAGPISTTRRAG